MVLGAVFGYESFCWFVGYFAIILMFFAKKSWNSKFLNKRNLLGKKQREVFNKNCNFSWYAKGSMDIFFNSKFGLIIFII